MPFAKRTALQSKDPLPLRPARSPSRSFHHRFGNVVRTPLWVPLTFQRGRFFDCVGASLREALTLLRMTI